MDVTCNCYCCFSADSLQILSGRELDVYLSICNTKDPKDDHTQITACLRCREFLKKIHRFRLECHGVEETIEDKLDVKPNKKQLDLRIVTADNLPQMEIKTERIDECNEMDPGNSEQKLETSLGNSLVDSVNLVKDNLSVALYDIKNHPLYKHAQERTTKVVTKRKRRCKIFHKPFSCTICNQFITTKEEFISHTCNQMSSKDKPYKCSECSFRTTRPCLLRRHIASKLRRKMSILTCDICGFRCMQEKTFSKHTMGHFNLNERLHKCSECSYTTIHKDYLESHITYAHNDEKPVFCDKGDRIKTYERPKKAPETE